MTASHSSPLPPQWFQILLSLADEARHGLGITRDVFQRTDGQMHLCPGMLYGALRKMTAAGLVTETEPPPDFEPGGGRPRFYAITPDGRATCAEEAERLSRYVEAARAKRLLELKRRA